MVYVLYTLFFLSCIVLVGSVLLQPGKTDAGALFTSNISSSAFAPRGTTTVLSKVTIAAAVLFMASALLLAMPVFNGNVSVLSSNPDTATESNSNTAGTDSNTAATVPDVNANASANTGTSSDNSNGSLIQTPATDQFANKAANTAATGNPVGNANSGKGAVKANKAAPAKSPAASNKK
jgi:preprotein translocase subunit SecG